MAKNGLATLYDDNGVPISSTATVGLLKAKGNALRVADNGTPILVSTAGSTAVAIAASAGTTVLKAAAGRLCRAVVTTAGTSADNITIYDNATTGSGTVLGVIPGGGTVGTVFDFQMPAVNGITAVNVASGPAATISYA
jgi:hypothetical protein